MDFVPFSLERERGVLRSVPGMIHGVATHLAVATDPSLNLSAMAMVGVTKRAGISHRPMVEFEADDALASAAARAAQDARLAGVIICSPDKDLAQVVNLTFLSLLPVNNNSGTQGCKSTIMVELCRLQF